MTQQKGLSQRSRAILVAALVLAIALSAFFAFSQDKTFFADIFRALFGLSGGNTAGGQ